LATARFDPKNQGDGIVLREATSISTTIRTRPGALAASGSPSAEMPLDVATQAQLQSEWQDINAKLAKLDFEAARRQAEIDTVKQTIAKLEATVPMAQTREADFKRLVGEGFISSHATQDKTRERVELERDLTVQRARLLEAQSALNETQQTKASYKSETLRTLSDRHARPPPNTANSKATPPKPASANAKPSSPPRWPVSSSNWPSIQ
jgi:hemolysin D